jgi:hypothetical protein
MQVTAESTAAGVITIPVEFLAQWDDELVRVTRQ